MGGLIMPALPKYLTNLKFKAVINMDLIKSKLKANSAFPWIAPSVIILFSITIIPTIFLFYTSLHRLRLGQPYDMREFIGLDNYIRLFTSSDFISTIQITLIYTLICLIIQFVVGFALALFFTQKDLIGRGTMVTLLVVPMTVTYSISGLIWRLYFNPTYGIINRILRGLFNIAPNWYSSQLALVSAITVDVWQWTPFVVLVLVAGLSSMPKSVIEASLVDGANFFQRLKYVILPIMKPIILIVLLLRSIELLIMPDIIFSLTEGGPGSATEILSIFIYRTGFHQTNRLGLGSAASVMLLVIAIILSQILIKYLGRAESNA